MEPAVQVAVIAVFSTIVTTAGVVIVALINNKAKQERESSDSDLDVNDILSRLVSMAAEIQRKEASIQKLRSSTTSSVRESIFLSSSLKSRERALNMTEMTGDHEAPSSEIIVKNPILNDKWYTILEWVARVPLPAVATLYTAVGSLWGWPNVTAIVGTIVAVDAFLGVFLGLAQKSYDNSTAKFDGSIVVSNADSGVKTFTLELDKDPDELAAMDKITFKVQPTTLP